MCGKEKWRKDRETGTVCPSALSPPSITIQLSLRWPDVGFVCPVSVSCVFARAQWKETLCQDFFCVYMGCTCGPNISIPILFLFVFPKLPVMDTFNKQFCKPTDMPMYFSVFLGQKHAAYCEFYLSLCTYGNMIQYAVQFCFSRDFYHPNDPPVSATAASH